MGSVHGSATPVLSASAQLGAMLELMRAQRQGLAVLSKQLLELRNDVMRSSR